MNLIDYQPYTFDDSSIISGSTAEEIALMQDSLNPDELTVEVISNDTGNGKLYTVLMEWYHTVDGRGYVIAGNDLRKFTYGDPVLYYYNDVLQGKYYIKSVERLSKNRFKLSAISAVGMWASVQHMGGIYDGETVGDVVTDLLSGFTYTIDPDVASVPLYGWLPIASVRDNLQQVLFAVGANLTKDASGNPHIKYLDDLTALPVSGDRIYIGGKLSYKTPSTKVTVTEHSYYISSYDVEVSLFDNTDGSGVASNKLVTFSEPCHSLEWNGLQIDPSWRHGANYCYVTGSGVLTGKKYTHTQKVFSVPTGVEGEPKESKVEKATLVSAVNSANVAARVSDYMATAEEVACGIVMDDDDIKPGSLISFTDPYDDETEGLVSKMNITMSGKSKAEATIVKNYTPGHFGNNFENFDLLTYTGQSASYTAKKTGTIRVVLAQGGQAGEGGQGGGNATCSEAGSGGGAGQGGAPGKVFVVDLEVTQGQTFTYRVGDQGMGSAGGDSGGGMGELGEEGEHSTFGSYTSADGAIPTNGYINILTGDVYSEYGLPGVDGGDGGFRENGEDVTYGDNTWEGGWALGSGSGRAGGGGAAYGSNGHFASYDSDGYYIGGDGADASTLEVDATLGSGGRGGCGGGGGGNGGLDRTICWGNAPGHGGYGSGGYYGGFGYIIVYY